MLMYVNNLDQVWDPTRLLFNKNRGLFPRRQRGRGMNTTHPYQVPTLKISGTIPPLAFMACTRTALLYLINITKMYYFLLLRKHSDTLLNEGCITTHTTVTTNYEYGNIQCIWNSKIWLFPIQWPPRTSCPLATCGQNRKVKQEANVTVFVSTPLSWSRKQPDVTKLGSIRVLRPLVRTPPVKPPHNKICVYVTRQITQLPFFTAIW